MALKAPRWCPTCRSIHDSDCPKAVAWEKSVHRASGRGGRPWQRKREAVFKRDHYLCQICLHKGVLTSVELHGIRCGVCDHRIPLSQGGADDDSNLQTICKACDKDKTAIESRRGGVGRFLKTASPDTGRLALFSRDQKNTGGG